MLESLFNKASGLQLYKKDTPTQVFSWEMRQICKNTFFYRTPPVDASYSDQVAGK